MNIWKMLWHLRRTIKCKDLSEFAGIVASLILYVQGYIDVTVKGYDFCVYPTTGKEKVLGSAELEKLDNRAKGYLNITMREINKFAEELIGGTQNELHSED